MTDPPPADLLRFLQWHRPAIAAGDYTIQVTQEISAPGITEDNRFVGPEMSFSVRGERFALPPVEVHAVFPPRGSMGDHSKVLPHVVLRRSTLPWERRADPNDKPDEAVPWLALLVFHEGEIGEPKTMSLADATNPKFPDYNPNFHHFEPERGQTADDLVLTVIDVRKELLGEMLPSKKELAYLAHARTRTRNEPADILPSKPELALLTPARGGEELAVIIANRLPKPQGFSTAHLVSLEDHYSGGEFEFKDAKNEDSVRLVSLASFRFGCFDPKQSFTELLRALDGATLLRLIGGARPGPQDQIPSTLRLPAADYPNATDSAGEQLALGAVPMRYSLRQGQTTAAWYHGPLAPAKNPLPAATRAPARTSDELLRYSPRTGMFDVSYAAAWEIGRLVALRNKKFSVGLHHWKQAQAKLRQLAQNPKAHPLCDLNEAPPDPALPEQLRAWLDDLSLLEGVPFSYLVPDERMLPPESIRIFWLDWFWIECLLDGAFSIGRHTNADAARDAEHKTGGHLANPHPAVTGVVLRSEVVSGWPGLQVDGYDQNNHLLKALRTQRLSPNVLVCFFDGEIGEVRIHQKVETLHFGLDEKKGRLVKKLRDGKTDGQAADAPPKSPEGGQALDLAGLTVNVPLRGPEEKRILDIDRLAQALGASTSAEFALQMIEGVEEVAFSVTPPPTL